MNEPLQTQAALIAARNDEFRRTGKGGQVVITRGVFSEGDEFVGKALAAVKLFDAFEEGNDPYEEHDFGSVQVGGRKLFWKIDYYDTALEWGSPDPADPAVTRRILTIMLAEEY